MGKSTRIAKAILTLSVLGVTYGLCFLAESWLTHLPEHNLRNTLNLGGHLQELRHAGHKASLWMWPLALLDKKANGKSESRLTDKSGKELLPLIGGLPNHLINLWWGFLDEKRWEWVDYPSDEWAFNNPKGIWNEPSPDIWFLGDSFTIGFSATLGHSFADRVRKQYPKTVNLGLTGNSPLSMLGELKEFLPHRQPKLIVWMYYEENDLSELLDESTNAILTRYLEPHFSQHLWERRAEVLEKINEYLARVEPTIPPPSPVASRPISWKLTLLRAMATRTATELSTTYEMPPATVVEEALPLFRKTLREAKRVSSQYGSKLVVAYIPYRLRYQGIRHYSTKQMQRVLDAITAEHLEVFNLDPYFKQAKNPNTLYPSATVIADIHPNNVGHALIADALLTRIPKWLKNPHPDG